VNNASTSMVDLHSSVHSSISEVQTFDIDSIGGKVLCLFKPLTGSEADNQRSYFSQNSKEHPEEFSHVLFKHLPDIEELEGILTDDDRDSNIFVVKENTKFLYWKPYEEQSQRFIVNFMRIVRLF
jgi:hypothetical protein